MQCFPYLSFDGKANEALEFYKKATGGETRVLYFKDIPANPANPTPDSMMDHISNGALIKDGVMILMVSDKFKASSANPSDSTHINLVLDSLAEAEQIYAVLSEGATIVMPLAEAFWAERYAMFTDKFGINWMLNFFGNKKR